MIGFWMTNLIIPDEPNELSIRALSGNWELSKCSRYSELKSAIVNGKCAHTYVIENSISINDGAEAW